MSTNEWYTPAEYIQSVRDVLGEIDLDPASCAFAQETVGAKKFYTKEENGLMYPWHGRVFLNPPFGKTLQGGKSNLEIFTRYLIAQYERGNVSEAILLIPVSTGTRWFAHLWMYPICFPPKRIRFNTEKGKSDGPSFDSCFVYLGSFVERFSEVFLKHGDIARSLFNRPIVVKEEMWTACKDVPSLQQAGVARKDGDE